MRQMDNPISGQMEWPGRIAGLAAASTWAGYVSSRQLATAAHLAAPQEDRRAILASDAAGDSEGNGLGYDQFERREPASNREALLAATSELPEVNSPCTSTWVAENNGSGNRVHAFHRVDYQA